MNKIITLLYVFTVLSIGAIAQDCVPDFGVPSAGLFPATATATCFTQGTSGELVLTLKNFTTAGPGGAYTVDSAIIDSVTNLPCGLKYSIFPRSKKLNTGESGCIRIHGTTSDAVGQYSIRIYAKVYATPDIPGFEGSSMALDFLGSLNTPALDMRYWVRVKGSGACAAVDTATGSSANKIATCRGIDNTSVSDVSSSYTNLYVGPNPVADFMNVNFTSDKNSEITYTIHSLNGQMLLMGTMETTAGNNQIQIDASAIQTGLYFITISNGEDKITTKFSKL